MNALGKSGHQQDTCEVSRKGLYTSRKAVQYLGIYRKSLETSRIVVKSLG